MLLSKFTNPSSISFPTTCLPRHSKPTDISLIRSQSLHHSSHLTSHATLLRLTPNRLHRRLSPIRAEKKPNDSGGTNPSGGGGAKLPSFSGWRYPPMTKKPQWWWRTLACLPYLMPLHHTWVFAETAYNLHPFLEEFEFVTYPFLTILGGFPRWFPILYFLGGYLLIARRKEWPHFLRFHVILGLLIEIALQICGFVWKRLPLSLYWGKFGAHFWLCYCFAHLFTVLECIRCALCGMYADVPGFSDAAYIQVPYD